MTYFSYIPNTTYEFNGATNVVKDICKRSKFISEYKPYMDLYSTYTIRDSDSLQSIALEYYGAATYHWVIALFNEMHDLDFEFPLSQLEMENYCIEKYGNNLYGIKYYINSDGIAVGEIKDYTENYVNPVEPSPITNEEYTAITFYDYENTLNEEKRIIKLMRPELLSTFVTQFDRSFK